MAPQNKNRKDPAWKYGILPNPNDTNKVVCSYCNKETNGGINRFKKHLIGGHRDVKMCPRCPKFVRDKLRNYMAKKKEVGNKRDAMPHFDEVVEENDCEAKQETTTHGKRPISYPSHSFSFSSNQMGVASSQQKKPRKKGPIDWYFHQDEVITQKKNDDKNSKDFDEYQKKMRDNAVQKFARWMYDVGMPFTAVKRDSFAPMIEAIGQYGHIMKLLSYHEMKFTNLKKELEHKRPIFKDHEIEHLQNLISIKYAALRRQNKKCDTIDPITLPQVDVGTEEKKEEDDEEEDDEWWLEEDNECYKSYSSDENEKWYDEEEEEGDDEDHFDDDKDF